MKLIIENEDMYEYDFEFTKFNDAIKHCEDTYGYEGEAWELVKETMSLHSLHYFLQDDGIHSELIN